jgi:NTE family protein
MKRALVLSGGGEKGAFQVGVLSQLLEDDPKLDYDIYTGISVGALNASMLATGPLNQTLPKLEKIWFEKVKGNGSIWKHHALFYLVLSLCLMLLLTAGSFVSFILTAPMWLTSLLGLLALVAYFLVPYLLVTKIKNIYNTKPLKAILKRDLNPDDLKQSGKVLRVGAVNLLTGEYERGGQNSPDIRKWVAASSSYPIFFPTEKINNDQFTDGGVVEIAPLSDAMALGATDVDVILCSPLEPDKIDKVPGLLGQFVRLLDLMTNEIMKNDLVKMGHSNGSLNIRLFMPKTALPTQTLQFNPKTARKLYDIGREVAKHPLDR